MSAILRYMKKIKQGFPGDSGLKNPAANTGDKFDPWSGRIPHAEVQLSPGATLLRPHAATTEAQASILEPVLPREKSLRNKRDPGQPKIDQ